MKIHLLLYKSRNWQSDSTKQDMFRQSLNKYLNRYTFFTSFSSFKANLSGLFPWDMPVGKFSPEWVTGPEQGKSSGRVATFSLRTGIFWDGISSIPDETVIPLWLARHRLPRVMKHYFPTGRRNYGRPLKRLLDTWDRNGSTSRPTPWHIWW